MPGPHALPASDTLDGLTLTETEIVAAIATLKEQRDALRLGDPARYEFQDQIYRRNQDLIFLRRAKQRK